ncbi:extracellular solute-binding protein [Paenibacillus sp. LHD-38]|uniref:extracellular solute-binding protein n=1 Tax=Paenibacillus sp. LHD-38 TaxID=3072143 RepID=UPI00280DD55A|nr:extracellular solute-binding protein [Paenibacillus sp. LHD-38]MDQ8737110.1 extracellular solute-binding protein [Paenibacillus sp. LHD-38]
MKKTAALLLCLCLMMSVLAACGSGKSEDIQANGDQETADKAPITYSINVLNAKETWDNNVSQKLAEQTGVSFNYVPIVGDRNQKMDLWLAGEDYPDVLYLQPRHIGKYRDAGAIIPLEDLIDQYGPNIKKKFGKYFNLLKDTDGHIYSLYSPNMATETPASNEANFIIRYDVLKEAGYPEIKTLEQLYNLIQDYYKKHPTTENGEPTIPFSGYGGSAEPDFLTNNPAFTAAGLPDHARFLVNSDNTLSLNFVSEPMKRYTQFLNKVYNAGLMDKEFFTMNAEMSQSKLAQGTVLAGFFPGWTIGGSEAALRASGKGDKQYASIPILFDEQTVDHNNTKTPTNSNNNWAISKNAKHPERVIQMIDFLFTDEGQKLINWGLEGANYEVKDGKRALTAEYVKKTTENPDAAYKDGPSGPYTVFSFGNGSMLDDGDYATPLTKDYVKSKYDPATNEILSKYGKEVWADFLPKLETVPAYLWQLNEPEEHKLELKRIVQIYMKELPKIIFAKNDAEFEQLWTSYTGQIDAAGRQKVEETWTKLWKGYMEQYNQAVGSK